MYLRHAMGSLRTAQEVELCALDRSRLEEGMDRHV